MTTCDPVPTDADRLAPDSAPIWQITRRAVGLGAVIGGCIGGMIGVALLVIGAIFGVPIGGVVGATLGATSVPLLVRLARQRASRVRIRVAAACWCVLVVASIAFVVGAAGHALSTAWFALSGPARSAAACSAGWAG